MTITSHHNEKLKEIRKLTARKRERERTGRFVAEGEDLLAAADAAGWEPLARLCAAGSGLAGEEVVPEVLAAVSTLGSGTRTLAIYSERWAPAATGPLCVALFGVSDPGNVGAVLRSARAFGAACVALGPGTADPFGPKAVRASMGAVFEVALARVTSVEALPPPTIALSADAETELSQLDCAAASFLVGAERDGLPAAVAAAAQSRARIPIQTHSLNAAMAATVALYEARRGLPGRLTEPTRMARK